jgi:4-deoxy-L-threo-5-hexosulose-uronate ketol-isomerase
MTIREPVLARWAAGASPAELRQEFLVSGLFRPGAIGLESWESDRAIVGGICPLAEPLELPTPAGLRSPHFFARREGGIVNLGGPGFVKVDGTLHPLDHLDALYVGRGTQQVTFGSTNPAAPARFWLLSYPAHVNHPNRHVKFAAVEGVQLGQRETANERTLYKLIHPGAFPTCQLVLGITKLQPGSVWNTMPPHTHLRRSEIYLYFDLPPEHAVFHFMGKPDATRHLVVRDLDVVLSPPWSIHSGVGTSNYGFVWGMGGENQEFADMDPAPVRELR